MTERKRRVRIGRLTNVGQIASEIARVYRHARHGDIDSTEGYKLASILGVMAKCLEASELERRLNEIETVMLKREQPFKPRMVS